jgi:hypothetical protein
MLLDDLRMGLDPVAFCMKRIGIIPDAWQEAALRWAGKRLILNCSRQSGKSTITAILGLHRALYHPDSLILLVSPSLRQSSELFRKVSDFLKSGPDKPKLIEDNKLSFTLPNGSRVVSLPSSEATVRGFSGADLIIEDEASRVPDDLYRAIRPMVAVSGGRLILMSTPFGKRGHFFEEFVNGGDSWKRILVKADNCPRISREHLDEERRSLGEWWFRQEYNCEFVENEEQCFNHDLVMRALDYDVTTIPLL